MEPFNWERGYVVFIEGVEVHLENIRYRWHQHVDDITLMMIDEDDEDEDEDEEDDVGDEDDEDDVYDEDYDDT